MCKYHSTAVTHVAPIQVSQCELTSMEQVTDRFHDFNLFPHCLYVLLLVPFINSAQSKLHALPPTYFMRPCPRLLLAFQCFMRNGKGLVSKRT